MVVTARKLLLALYIVAGVGGICGLLYPYGGWHGNVDDEDIELEIAGYDVEIAGYLFFNRWRLPPDWGTHGEPLVDTFVFCFFVANFPAWIMAVLIDKGLFYLSCTCIYPTFAVPKFPLGLSGESYFLISFSIWGAVQWFLIGTLIDKWRGRRRKGKVGMEENVVEEPE